MGEAPAPLWRRADSPPAQRWCAQLPSIAKDITLRHVSKWRARAMVRRCRGFVRFSIVCLFLSFCLAFCLIAVCPIVFASKANAAARVSLVIGNGEYRYSRPLPNPVNDAQDVADALAQLDFTVIRVFNGDFGKLREGI